MESTPGWEWAFQSCLSGLNLCTTTRHPVDFLAHAFRGPCKGSYSFADFQNASVHLRVSGIKCVGLKHLFIISALIGWPCSCFACGLVKVHLNLEVAMKRGPVKIPRGMQDYLLGSILNQRIQNEPWKDFMSYWAFFDFCNWGFIVPVFYRSGIWAMTLSRVAWFYNNKAKRICEVWREQSLC